MKNQLERLADTGEFTLERARKPKPSLAKRLGRIGAGALLVTGLGIGIKKGVDAAETREWPTQTVIDQYRAGELDNARIFEIQPRSGEGLESIAKSIDQFEGEEDEDWRNEFADLKHVSGTSDIDPEHKFIIAEVDGNLVPVDYVPVRED